MDPLPPTLRSRTPAARPEAHESPATTQPARTRGELQPARPRGAHARDRDDGRARPEPGRNRVAMPGGAGHTRARHVAGASDTPVDPLQLIWLQDSDREAFVNF
jgi:hypothetical protein